MNPALPSLLLIALLALAGPVTAQAQTQTLHYPTEDESMFTIKAPGDWEVTGIDEVGEFGSLESENGSILQFRAIECENEKEMEAEIEAISESLVEFLGENYTDIELGDVQELEIEGMPAFQLGGTGKTRMATMSNSSRPSSFSARPPSLKSGPQPMPKIFVRPKPP